MKSWCLGCRVELVDPKAAPGDAAVLGMILVGIEHRLKGAPLLICEKHSKLKTIGPHREENDAQLRLQL